MILPFKGRQALMTVLLNCMCTISKCSFLFSIYYQDPPTRFPEHSEELQYLFYPKPPLDTFMPKITEDSNGFYFSRYFVSLWTTFARDG